MGKKGKNTPFDFGELANTISENESKNQKSLKEKVEEKTGVSSTTINNFAEEEIEKKEKESLLRDKDLQPDNNLNEKDNQSSTESKKRPGRPSGSKNKIKNSANSDNPLSSLLQQKETKVPISIYPFKSKVDDIDTLCEQYNVSRNEIICFFIDYALEHLD